MKKLPYYLLILLIPILTGCETSVGTGVFVGPGWGWGGPGIGTNIFFFPSVSRSDLTSKDIEFVNNIKSSAERSGYTVTDASTPETISFKASKNIENIDKNDVDGLPDFVLKNGHRFITVKRSPSKDYYKIKAIVDLSRIRNTELAINSPSKITLKMAIPTPATYTNAKRKINNGKILEWNLIPGKRNPIEADFEINK